MDKFTVSDIVCLESLYKYRGLDERINNFLKHQSANSELFEKFKSARKDTKSKKAEMDFFQKSLIEKYGDNFLLNEVEFNERYNMIDKTKNYLIAFGVESNLYEKIVSTPI